MSARAAQLHATADAQIAELTDLLSTLDDAALRRPCRGREKLGDGTVAANAQHTADNYQRIAAFVGSASLRAVAGEPAQPRAHRISGFLRHLEPRFPDHGVQGTNPHGNPYTADSIDSAHLVKQLSASRQAFEQIASLTDSQLDSIPTEGSFRFCDGQRTLEQVLTGLLKHQSQQLRALGAAVE